MQENLFATNHKVFDAIIVGGGPAGINCALELKYCGVECLLVNNDQQLGGQLLQIGEEIINVAGRSFKNGPAMAKRMHRQVQDPNTPSNPSNPNVSKIKLLLGRSVDSIDAKKMTISISEDVYQTRVILLCTGYRLKKLGMPGISKFKQRKKETLSKLHKLDSFLRESSRCSATTHSTPSCASLVLRLPDGPFVPSKMG